MISAGESEEAVRAALERFSKSYGDEPASQAAFLDLAAPFREVDLEQARITLWTEERQTWENQTEALKEAERAREAQRRQAADAAAAQQREIEADRQRAAERERLKAETEADKDRLRWQAVALCREQRYGDAATLFVPLAVSNTPEARAWAESKQRCIALAKQLLDSIINSKTDLAGTVLPIPRQRGEWKVTRIGFKGVDLERRRTVFHKGERSEDVETMELAFTALSPAQINLLTQRKWQLDGQPENDRQLLIGAYLLAQALYLPEARRRLELNGSDDAKELLEELEVVEHGAQQFEFTRYLAQVQALVEQGDTQRAKALVAYLRRAFPQETAANQERIDALIPLE
mgnify:CR=1 FL=1